MANRTVSVILQAEIGSYVAGMTKAALATKGVGETADTTGAKASKGFDLAGKGALLMGGAVAGALVGIISKSMDFEKSMSGVQAATQASAATLGDLREAAMKAGADTQYSATEAADAITEMAKAGVSAGDIMGGGLNGALSLAAAGQMDVADAAGIASTAMTQFSLSGKDLPHVADLLAAGAGKAMGSVDDLGQALNQAGLVASSTGMSIEETTGTLSAFASAGLLGSDAGTSLKTMLQQLQNPSKESAELMDKYGISLYDASGKFVGMANLAGQLQEHLGGLNQATRDQAMAQIFGSDAVRAANVLYKEGAAGIEGWTSKVNDAGYAQEQAAALTDNLAGDIERLGGSFDTLMITIGEGAQGPLRMLTQGLGGVIDLATAGIEAFGNLPGPIQLAIGAFAAFGALDATGVLDKILEKVQPVKESLGGIFDAFQEALAYAQENGDGLLEVIGSMGETGMEAAKGGLKELASAIGPELGLAAATMTIGYLIDGIESLVSASEDAQKAAVGLADALTLTDEAADRKSIRNAIEDVDGLIDVLGKAGVTSTDAINGLLGQSDAQDRVTASLQRYMGTLDPRRGETTAEDVRLAKMAYDELATGYDNAAGTARYFADSADATGAATQGAADATSVAAQQTMADAQAAQDAIDKWLEQLSQVGADFVEPLSIYQDLLQTAAQATADATASSKDSWKDYADSASVSLDQFAIKLQEQITNQENWRANLVTVAQRAGLDVANALALMGQDGVQLTAQMANGTDAEVQRMGGLIIRDAQLGGQGAAAALKQEMDVMALVGKDGAGRTALGISTQLGIGFQDVVRIAAQYGVTLADGINPLLKALGKPYVAVGRGVSGSSVAPHAFAEGGYTGDGHKWEPKGIVHGGEYVVTKERTSKLGVQNLENLERIIPGYAGGGFVTETDVPRPRSVAPYQPPISTAGDAAMGKAYDTTTQWMRDNPMGLSGGTFGSSGHPTPNGRGGLGPVAAAAREYVMRAFGLTNIGGYSYRNIAGTNVLSDHATGHAIDVMIPNYKSPAGIAKGNQVANYFVGNAAKWGVKYVIWRDQINSGRGWGPYGHPGGGRSDTLQHRDHDHISFYKDGTDEVPTDRLAYLHAGEAVVPSAVNPASREFSGRAFAAMAPDASHVTINARVFIGDREITDIARVEAEHVQAASLRRQRQIGAYSG